MRRTEYLRLFSHVLSSRLLEEPNFIKPNDYCTLSSLAARLHPTLIRSDHLSESSEAGQVCKFRSYVSERTSVRALDGVKTTLLGKKLTKHRNSTSLRRRWAGTFVRDHNYSPLNSRFPYLFC